jgi:hypothetical protein
LISSSKSMFFAKFFRVPPSTVTTVRFRAAGRPSYKVLVPPREDFALEVIL